jgi:hypothetical protein
LSQIKEGPFFLLNISNLSLLEHQLTHVSNPTFPIALISPTFSAAKPHKKEMNDKIKQTETKTTKQPNFFFFFN